MTGLGTREAGCVGQGARRLLRTDSVRDRSETWTCYTPTQISGVATSKRTPSTSPGFVLKSLFAGASQVSQCQ